MKWKLNWSVIIRLWLKQNGMWNIFSSSLGNFPDLLHTKSKKLSYAGIKSTSFKVRKPQSESDLDVRVTMSCTIHVQRHWMWLHVQALWSTWPCATRTTPHTPRTRLHTSVPPVDTTLQPLTYIIGSVVYWGVGFQNCRDLYSKHI